METLGSIPIMENDFGFYTDKNKAGKTFIEAFPKEFKQYNSETLEKTISGECRFNDKGLLTGSNVFVLSLIRKENLLPENQFLFTPENFATAFNKNPEVFRGTYQDQGLAITISPGQSKNSNILIQTLARQVKDFGYDASPQSPIFVYHSALNPITNQDSPCGFIFDIKDKKGIVKATAFGVDNTIKRFSKYDKKAVPIPKEDGDYIIYSVPRNSGVSRVCSNYIQGADSSDDHLAGSNAGGRVAVGTVVPRDETEFKKLISQERTRRETAIKNLETELANLKTQN